MAAFDENAFDKNAFDENAFDFDSVSDPTRGPTHISVRIGISISILFLLLRLPF